MIEEVVQAYAEEGVMADHVEASLPQPEAQEGGAALGVEEGG